MVGGIAQILATNFDIAHAQGDVMGSHLAVVTFGQNYGGTETAACAAGNAAIKPIKTTMVTKVAELDSRVVPTNEYLLSLACSLNKITPVPGEHEAASTNALVALMSDKLGGMRSVADIPFQAIPASESPVGCARAGRSARSNSTSPKIASYRGLSSGSVRT